MNDERDGELEVQEGNVEQHSDREGEDEGVRVRRETRALIEAAAGMFGAPVVRDYVPAGADDESDEPAFFAFAEGTGVHRVDSSLEASDGTSDEVAAEVPAEVVADAAAEPVGQVPVVSRKVNKPRVRTRRTRPRSKTIALKRLTRAELAKGALESPPVEDAERPVTRAECVDGPRPCPWVACKHHLYLDINPRTGSIKLNFPDLEPWELEHTCALDVADSGALTLEEIGLITNLTRERVRQVEVRGLLTLKSRSNPLR